MACAENHVKVETDGTSKKVLTHRLALAIWDFADLSGPEDLEYCRLYRENPKKFETLLLGHLNT